MVPENVQHDVSVNEAIWGLFFMNSCMWGAVHLHHEQDQMRRALRIMDVEQIQQIFTTMENQIIDLQFKELAGPYGQLSWE